MPMMTFLETLELAHKGKGTLPPEMNPVEILKETGMSLTEQNQQPASFIQLLMLDIQTKRRVDKAAQKAAERKAKPKARRGR